MVYPAPTMKPEGFFTGWSHDFIEHVRLVHFTLFLLSAVLILVTASSTDRELQRASAQAERIGMFLDDWPDDVISDGSSDVYRYWVSDPTTLQPDWYSTDKINPGFSYKAPGSAK